VSRKGSGGGRGRGGRKDPFAQQIGGEREIPEVTEEKRLLPTLLAPLERRSGDKKSPKKGRGGKPYMSHCEKKGERKTPGRYALHPKESSGRKKKPHEARSATIGKAIL